MAKGPTKAETFLRHLEPLRGALEAYCRRALYDRGEVQDVLQSVVANAYRDFDLYAQGTNFRAWIFRYVHLEVLNYNRRHGRDRHEELPAAGPAAEEARSPAPDEPLFRALLDDPDAVLDQCDEAVAEAVRELDPVGRATLLLQAVGEFKYREIADILQVPIGTVMSSLSRSRARLRQRLVRYGEEQGLLKREAPPGPGDQRGDS
ncbi:MAG: RNA polymerase sigma factor [Planctomycetes bacterium]|nr:RNA polymerase sigma factor [Planctomycetota bacterium]